jgi:hypothetical protein
MDGDALTDALDGALATLLREVHASRATLRMDDPARGWGVDLVCAEALASGVKSMRGDGSIDQRAASTVQWMARHKTNLLQPDLLDSPDPPPPAALIAAYGAKAQMLGPLFDHAGHLAGWISAHYLDGPYQLTHADAQAMDRARVAIARLTGLGG